jgi:hypothetical protein
MRHERVISSGEGGLSLHVDDAAQARDGLGQPERLRPAEAVSDDHGAGEVVVDDVAHQLVLHSGQRWLRDGRNPCDARQRDHVRLHCATQALDRAVPDVTTAGESWKEEDRMTGAGGLDREGRRGEGHRGIMGHGCFW